ncbi:MAG: hypothetical protein ABMA64_19680 [Myxococcota bacterium]
MTFGDRWRRLVRALSVCVAVLAAAPTPARAVLAQVCVDLDTDFDLASVGAGDEWLTNAPRAARGLRLRVRSDTGTWVNAWADWEGADRGCASFTLDPARTYDIFAQSQILVNGVTVQVKDGLAEVASTLRDTLLYDDYVPPGAPATHVFLVKTLSTDDAYRWLAVIGHILSKTNFGIDPVTFTVYPQLTTGDPIPQDDGDLYGASPFKFLLAHEFGHALANKIEGTDMSRNAGCGGWDIRDAYGNGMPPENNCRAEIGGTSPKSMFSMEYEAMALREGWADFIAVYAWNDATESDCAHGRWGRTSDFDLDNDGLDMAWPLSVLDADNDLAASEDDDPTGWVSCEAVPVSNALCGLWGFADCSSNSAAVPLQSYISARDWLENVTTAADAAGCTSTTLVNRSTAADYARFFWDLKTDEGVPMSALAELWDNLNTGTIDPDDNDMGSCASTGTEDDVYYRLHAATTGAKFTTTCGGTPTNCADEVDAQANNGQDHTP